MSKYRLKKDMPHVKAGMIYFLNKNGENNCDGNTYLPDKEGMKHERWGLHLDFVENNPEWFERCCRVSAIPVGREKESNHAIVRLAIKDMPPLHVNKLRAIENAVEFILNENSDTELIKDFVDKSQKEILPEQEEQINAERAALCYGFGLGQAYPLPLTKEKMEEIFQKYKNNQP